VLKHGKNVREGFFQLRFLHNKENDYWRAAVVVSTKVSKSAPKRNRIRRRIYEIVRGAGLKPGIDVMILVYDQKVAEADHDKIKNNLMRLFDKANLI